MEQNKNKVKIQERERERYLPKGIETSVISYYTSDVKEIHAHTVQSTPIQNAFFLLICCT